MAFPLSNALLGPQITSSHAAVRSGSEQDRRLDDAAQRAFLDFVSDTKENDSQEANLSMRVFQPTRLPTIDELFCPKVSRVVNLDSYEDQSLALFKDTESVLKVEGEKAGYLLRIQIEKGLAFVIHVRNDLYGWSYSRFKTAADEVLTKSQICESLLKSCSVNDGHLLFLYGLTKDSGYDVLGIHGSKKYKLLAANQGLQIE